MNGYTLPTSVEINGTEYAINADFRSIIGILEACEDPNWTDGEKQEIMLEILYKDFDKIPRESREEACKKAVEFIDCGTEGKKNSPRLINWNQDGRIIVPAVNKVAGTEVRAASFLHWWTFLSYFMEIGDGLFSQVLAIRQKKAKHKKLEKWEQEFERENAEIVGIKKILTDEQKKEMEALEKWL